MSTPTDQLTALGFSAEQAKLMISIFNVGNAPTASPPTFSPPGGSYPSTQTIALSSSTPNSAIYFTEDGTTPTFPATGTTQLYTAPFQVAANTTITAITAASGYNDSAVQSVTYLVGSATIPQTTNPIMIPPGGIYTAAQQVALSCVTAGATIYFTTDGTTPTTASTIYAAPLTVSSTETINALALAPGFSQSGVASGTYTLNLSTAAAPTFTPAGGTYTSTQSVVLASTTGGASIYYTTDGSTPTTSSSLYSTAISVSASETIKAIAVATNFVNSSVSNAAYVITTQAAAPTFSPVAGTYAGNQSVALSGPTGASIYYTTDGTTPSYPPTGTTQLYTAPIPIPPGAATVATPTFSPVAGTYASAQSVSLLGPAGSTVYYTLDGSTPTTSSAVYSGAIAVSATETIKAIATAGGIASSVASALFTISAGGGGTGATLVFNYANFASTSGLQYQVGSATNTGNKINLIPAGKGHIASAAIYTTKVNVAGGFTMDLAFQYTAMSTIPSICGMTAGFQATTSPPGASGFVGTTFNGDANCCGYGSYNPAGRSGQFPPVNSAAIKFDANASSNVGAFVSAPSSTGYYENGGPYNGLVPENDLQPDGISFYNGNICTAHIVYDGVGTTVCTLTDTATGAQSRMEYASNWQNAISGNTAYPTVTAGGAGTTPEGIDLISWKLSTGYLTRLSQPTFSPAAGQYSGSQTVTISGPSGATIYYTVNGRMPTTASTQYTGPITVAANQVVKAIAVQSGFTDSITTAGVYRIGTANYVNCGAGFGGANNGTEVCGSAQVSGTAINLTTSSTQGGEGASGSLWFMQPVPVNTFSAAFTLQYATSNSSGAGTCFVLQNAPPAKTSASTARAWTAGLHAVGANRFGFGQGGNISDSGGDVGFTSDVALAFDPSASSVGLYFGGAQCNTAQISTGMNFSTGNPINCTLAYDGTNLALTMADPIAATSFSHTFTPVNIPNAVGGNLAYAGFTASGYFNIVNKQAVTKWTM